jgi:hypothetical protein
METAMTPFDHFDRILSNFNRVEERLFLNNVREFAEEHPEVVIKTFSMLLKKQKLNIQLKYLALKSIRELKYPELIPTLKETLNQENKVQIISEAVNSLAAIGTLPAYKVITGLMKKQEDNDYKEKLEQGLKTIFTRNQLVYHFDVFFRDRGSVSNIDKSSEFLIKHLPDQNIKELLPGLASRFSKIRMETLRILKSRPNPIYYSTIYYYFKENARTADEELFLLMSEALVNNASLSNAKMKIFQKLKVHQEQLKGDKRNVFSIVLLKLNTREIIPHIVKTYPKLNLDRKLLLFEHLNPGDYLYYMDFIRELLRCEDNQSILAKIVEILVYANDFKYLFETIDIEKGVRKHKLFNMILEHDPEGIDHYLKKYVTPSQENQILLLSLDYLARHAADNYFELITGIFFSGVSQEIKILVLRNVNKFEPQNQRLFVESIFIDTTVVRDFKKDFLFSLLGVMNAKVFDEELEEKILNRVLVFMEEASVEELVNFVFFFEKYEINNRQDCELIINEFRLIQNTLLKSSSEQDLVRMVHVLIKNIDRKMTLKKKK